jgi:ADP-ribose pyrophosphatase
MTRIVPRRIVKVFEGRVLTLQQETITLPRGDELVAEIVRHPGSVVIVPVTDDGSVILVRQYRHAIGDSAWELPAGSLKPGEEPDQAAMRECQEEIGLVPAAIERIGALFPTPGYCDEKMTFYQATGLREPGGADPEVHQDEDEDIEARAFPLAQVRAMIASGEIVDMKTLAGLALLTDPALRRT